ncbi:MAG: glycosyltransferase family 4 protein, partial [Bdellovibrionota bacterium]
MAAKRHVLWVNGWPQIGGAERAQLTLFRELRDQYRFTVVLPSEADTKLIDEVRVLGFEVKHAPLTSLRRTLNPFALARFGGRLAVANLDIFKILNQERFDLVHTAYSYDIPFCAIAARIKKLPVFWLIENPEIFNRVKVGILNSFSLHGIGGTSTKILSEAVHSGLRANRSAWIPNGYDDHIFHPNLSPRSPSSGSAVKIGFAGIFSERKGVLELCRAFGALRKILEDKGANSPQIELWLAGNGEAHYKKEIQKILEYYGIQNLVHFESAIHTPQKMFEFYQKLDLYVMLSKREGMSVAMLEAMGSGVASAILSPWGDDVITDPQVGIRLTTDDPNAVAIALLPIVLDANKRNDMARAGEAKVRAQFSSHQAEK